MQKSNLLIVLVSLVALFTVIVSGVGLFYQDGGSTFSFTTIRGEVIPMYGQGLYRYELVRDAVGLKGADAYAVLIGVPLLLISAWMYWQGSLRGGLVLTGTLAYFAYNAASMTFGYAYNLMFLLYIALLTTSIAATGIALASFDLSSLPRHFSNHLPRRGIAAFLFMVGVSLLLVWGGLDIIPALLSGKVPALTGHTTLPTHALDMGLIAPAAFIAAVLLLRRTALGYLLASTLLIVSAVLGAGILALSGAQIWSGVVTFQQTIVFVVPFVLLATVAMGFTVSLLRHVSNGANAQARSLQPSALLSVP